MFKIGIRKRSGCAVALAVVLALIAAAGAQAATVTVGQLFAPVSICTSAGTILQTGVASGTPYAVSSPGVITSWSFQDNATVASGLKLKVARDAGSGSYTIAAQAAAGGQTANAVNTYSASIPVRPGDLIGIYMASGSCGTGTGNPGDTVAFEAADPAPGTTDAFTASTKVKVPVSVQVTLQPGVSAVSPSDGATAGGDRVTITGHDFTGATAVSFGGVPAQSFTVDSDSSITAVSPAGAVGLVDVSVTTPGGQSPVSAADRFTYVPRPVVTSVSPARGATGGGTSVTITGHDLTGATAVSFGGQPARGFGVVSDTVITAVSPALPPGTVDVTVTTAGGQSTTGTADHFTYPEVCVVPKLTGKRLRQAKRALGHAHCKLGTVKGPRKGKVNHQSPRHGEVLPADARVNVRLG